MKTYTPLGTTFVADRIMLCCITWRYSNKTNIQFSQMAVRSYI